MDYIEIADDEEVITAIQKIREKYSAWRQIIIPSERETTMRGKTVVTLFLKFDPVCKVEGDAELVNQFTERLLADG